jgi:SAM-dependent methyltransferase
MMSQFDEFRAEVLEADRLSDVAVSAGVDPGTLATNVRTALGEAEFTLRMLSPHLDRRLRLLEVGAGLGITSAFLASRGFDITSIEPGGSGFEDNERINPALRASLGIDHPHRHVAVETVTVSDLGGRFDLIFSNNVLEHVDDVGAALDALDALLSRDGMMIHHCPNYTVPFEPHFGVPLVPGAPERTAALLPDRISSTGLWASLNFVTASDIRRIGRRHGATVVLQDGLLADSVQRLTEPEFGQRHPGLRRVARLVEPLLPLMRRIPASYATPMVFTWQHHGAAAAATTE